MSGVEIRPARDVDLAVLIGTFGEADFFADRLVRQAGEHGVLLTAWDHDTPIGAVYVWKQAAEEVEVRQHLPGVPLLNHVQVHSDYRNRRIGTELVIAAEKLLVDDGHSRVALAVRTDNPDAYRLYERLGYKQWPHPPVECQYYVRLPDGTRKRCVEICHMMVKPLRRSSA
ncbi:hypothetical protein ALI144C_04115 [Actinosynnema sp. ALI-1.44]|uniref:GNAT family N-acetyltransferase n=1 Tax=Actinosynnema sp. ALI-1.44 TaxID=1933779 RepID=UPI00097CAD69|nr:GNAT family N-acetyltransferase [Actinosynnema sp. ALI-1.44]ONI89882.1 hypothetical protein ALI144C_04115 [Actinosynnema sp. ALI-1.44]